MVAVHYGCHVDRNGITQPRMNMRLREIVFWL